MSTPSEIARETLIALATRKQPPTPDNFARVYREISGEEPVSDGASAVLEHVGQRLAQSAPQQAALEQELHRSIKSHNWAQCQTVLLGMLSQRKSEGADLAWSALIRELLRQMEFTHKGVTLSRKKEGLDTVLSRFGGDATALYEKIQGLIRSWGAAGGSELASTPAAPEADVGAASAPRPAPPVAASSAPEYLSQLRELLATTLEHIQHLNPELTSEAQALIQRARIAADPKQVADLAKLLRQFWLKLELRGTDRAKIQDGLVRLLRLLVENVGELVADDKWLHGQVSALQDIIEQPLDKHAIADAERNLRNAIIKQSTLKQSLADAKVTLKTLMSTFINRLGELTESTGDYHAKIEGYTDKIGKTDNLTELSHLLHDIMQDTRVIQTSVMRSHEELVATRKQAEEAEERIRKLEQELEEVSEMVREDQLTGALNRRGMEETLEREIKRSERTTSPLCIALLDIDNFKQLNDTLGHQAGDRALVHLSHVIKTAIRPTDAVARYGGEEFLIILPDTALQDGVNTIERLQRELTKKFFLHNNDRKLITFSAGVALLGQGEEPLDLIGRADKAMYIAKKSGKNRVIPAE